MKGLGKKITSETIPLNRLRQTVKHMLHWILDFLFKIIFMTAYCFAVRQCFNVKIRILDLRDLTQIIIKKLLGIDRVQHRKVIIHMRESVLLFE